MPTALNHYFDLAEFLALRSAALALLFVGLYRFIRMELRKK
jgi:hypothetical protein